MISRPCREVVPGDGIERICRNVDLVFSVDRDGDPIVTVKIMKCEDCPIFWGARNIKKRAKRHLSFLSWSGVARRGWEWSDVAWQAGSGAVWLRAALRGMARRGRRGKAWQGADRYGKVRQGRLGQAWTGEARQGTTGLGEAGRARSGQDRRGEARRGRPG